MVDRDPIEAGPEITRHVLHQVAREAAEIVHRTGVFGADDEAEMMPVAVTARGEGAAIRSEEHTSELQSLMRISYAVFCLKKKKKKYKTPKQVHNRNSEETII